MCEMAWAIAHICRYVGQADCFYSVAEHSILVSQQCEPADAFEGLMHDCCESITGDVTSPMKRAMRYVSKFQCAVSPYDLIEEKHEAAMCIRFGLRHPWPPSVKAADLSVLALEKVTIRRTSPMPWFEEIEPAKRCDRIVGYGPVSAYKLFMDRFRQLAPADIWERERQLTMEIEPGMRRT